MISIEAALIAKLSPGALLAKVDIESAYSLIPVHPQDRPLQAMRWEGQLYIDPMLPFGLRLAPKIFNAVADALNWHLHQSGIPLTRHYLDDFIIVAPPHSSQCREVPATLDRECRSLGVPIADHISATAPLRAWSSWRSRSTRRQANSASQQINCSACRHSCVTGGTTGHARARNWSRWWASSTTPAKSSAPVGCF